MTYYQMCRAAVTHINKNDGLYKGYRKGNAISLYIYDHFGVNAASNNWARDAICDVAYLLEDEDSEV